MSSSIKKKTDVIDSISPWLEMSRNREICLGYSIFVILSSVLLGAIQIYYGTSKVSKVLNEELRNTSLVTGAFQFIFAFSWTCFNLYAHYLSNEKLSSSRTNDIEVVEERKTVKSYRFMILFLGSLVTFLLLINFVFIISLIGGLCKIDDHIDIFCQAVVGSNINLIHSCVSSFGSWFGGWRIVLPLSILIRIPLLMYLMFCLVSFFLDGRTQKGNSLYMNTSYANTSAERLVKEDFKSSFQVEVLPATPHVGRDDRSLTMMLIQVGHLWPKQMMDHFR